MAWGVLSVGRRRSGDCALADDARTAEVVRYTARRQQTPCNGTLGPVRPGEHPPLSITSQAPSGGGRKAEAWPASAGSCGRAVGTTVGRRSLSDREGV